MCINTKTSFKVLNQNKCSQSKCSKTVKREKQTVYFQFLFLYYKVKVWGLNTECKV